MTVYLPKAGRTYRFDFEWRGRRYFGSTGQLRLEDAREWERKERVRLARQVGGLALRASETPRIHDWAETFYAYKAEKLKRPDLLERELRIVLEFCGGVPLVAPPASTRKNPPPRRPQMVAPPRHDLRLGDFIESPEWILAFEDWLRQRGTGPSARNHYRSIMSGLFTVAMLPQFRRATGISSNPFAAIERDRPPRRRVTLTVEQLRAWVLAAQPHIKLALAIGGLVPGLRKANILALQWAKNFDAAFRFVTVHDHKGDRARPEPLTQPIPVQLRTILEQARGRAQSAYVIEFRKRGVKSITKGLRNAAHRAKIPYGMQDGGATFHTLRHTMATLLAELGVPESQRRDALSHADVKTTQIYTHLRPMHLVGPIEQLSAVVNVSDLVLGGFAGEPPATARKAERRRGNAGKGRQRSKAAKSLRKTAKPAPRRRAS